MERPAKLERCRSTYTTRPVTENTSVNQVIRFRPIDAYQHPNLDLGGNLVRERLAVDLLDGDECRVESKDGDLLLLLGAIAGKESRLALDD